MTHAPRTVLAASLIGLGLASVSAQAQPVPYYYAAPEAPTVLQQDRDTGVLLVPPNRSDLAVPAIPVPSVMNGGGFGLTGFDYYNDSLSEGRFGARRRPKEFVLAPALIAPLPGR
ncbi:hypothetical protein [Methylobacterium planeticum]|uniref:Uncharacterized protein n=1 Tax=Methylobacterium planeticum TaxID=2615211 RepID=A0A6N6MX40_9HYPH|nr:hypothetical protein [Methylobacterium planeticum]KAB1076261.1 hypothetical protein F6X51_01620 [Methylobacterium planeticum]